MSVRVNDRGEQKLAVLGCTLKLSEYTIKICKNDKVFPKNSRWIMANRIVNECLDAHACVRRANATPLGERYRVEQQNEAYSHLECLLSYITLSYKTYSIEGRRIEHWTKLVVDAEIKLKAWMKSDKTRIK